MTEKRPRIAVTYDADYNIDAYLQAVELAGGNAVAVLAEHSASMSAFDGLLLSGGVDVNPLLYGQSPIPETEYPDDARDGMEREMLRDALAMDKPVLAICRGLQLFNVAHGGTLHQHIERHVQPDGTAKSEPAHAVKLNDETRLAGLLGGSRTEVNSRHHQSVDRVGENLSVSAEADDGTVEGLERTDLRFAVAVQWHPENMATPDSEQLRLFEGFIAAARAAER